MSKVNDKMLALLQKPAQSAAFAEGFEERESSSKKAFRAEFISAPLSDEENQQIHQLLEASFTEGQFSTDEVEKDHQNLTELTTQIRAIEVQSVLLHGDRIYKAQSILKKYQDGTFSNWLQLAYGNRQTPYRYLQFYDLFNKLEKDEKELMNSMPKQSAYKLASRNGEIEKKVEIIKEYHDCPQSEINQAIQEAFPLKSKDKRRAKENDADTIKVIRLNLRKLVRRKEELGQDTRKSLADIRLLIDDILDAEYRPIPIDDPQQLDMLKM